MFAVSKLLVLFSVALSVAAAPSHYPRDARPHHALAPLVNSPQVAHPVPAVELRAASPRLRKRASGKCSPPSSNAPGPSSSAPVPSSPVAVPSSSPSLVVVPSSTQKPPAPKTSTTSTAAAPPSTTSPSSGGGQTFSGDGTFYATGLGSCGITNTDSDMIAAVAESMYDTFPGYTGGNPNNNPICGKKALVTYQGKTITVTITDRCTGCAFGALDFSPAAFNQLADPSIGRIHGLEWHFI